jgi:hypothetical protein
MPESKITPIRDADMIAQLMGNLRSHQPVIYEHLLELFKERREIRRIQAEAAPEGHQAVRLLGRCTELTTILNDLFNQR